MQFTIFGDNYRQGSYLLAIDLGKPADISFGRFLQGRPVHLEAGRYLYVGSALGSRSGGWPLAGRLLRHALRSGAGEPHAIRGDLLELFSAKGYRAKPGQTAKRLHWHIDYLLDLPEAELSHIIIVGLPSRLEERLAGMVAATPDAEPVVDRLGAQDAASGTHLFSIGNLDMLLHELETYFTKAG